MRVAIIVTSGSKCSAMFLLALHFSLRAVRCCPGVPGGLLEGDALVRIGLPVVFGRVVTTMDQIADVFLELFPGHTES